MSNLEKAVELAAQAHNGHVDKAGEPYILHPLRVMFQVQGESARIAAVLHDVVEDSEITLEDLRQAGFSEEVVTAVEHVTKRDGEDYEDFIKRAASNPIALKVKIADVQDNMNMMRLKDLTERDWARLQKYHQAMRYLTDISKGPQNP